MSCGSMEKRVAAMSVKWEELFREILGFLSLVWRNPIYLAYIVYFGPRLLRMVLFFCPLLISTCLFMLVFFSLGPQVERIRIEGELQWKRFRESSWRDDREFRAMKRVKRPVMCCRDLWDDFFRDMHVGSLESDVVSDDPLLRGIEKQRLSVEFAKCKGGGIPMPEGETLYPGQSIIVSKIRVFMDKLVAELGGRVECSVLNALEVISEALIETTQRLYEEETMSSSNSALGAAENRESCDMPEEEAKTLGEFPSLDNSNDVKDKYVDSLGEFPLADDNENVDKQIHIVEPLIKENFPHVTDLEAPEEEVGAITVHGDAFETPLVVSESLLEDSCTAKISDTSQDSGEEKGVLDSDPADPSESKNGLPSLENCVFRSCRSFPLNSSEEEFLAMDRLWEEDNQNMGLFSFEKSPPVKKEKDWKRTLACKLHEEQQNLWRKTLAGKFYEECSTRFHSPLSPSVKIPEHQSYTDFFCGKSTSSSSNSPAFTTAETPLNAEEMDLLWEEYNDAQGEDSKSQIKGLAKSLAKLRSLKVNADSDTDEGPETPRLCCLKALRFSPGKMPLRRPSLVKFSKALKNLGFIQHLRGPKQHTR